MNWIVIQAIFSLVIVVTVAFGLKNLTNFYERIFSVALLRDFYIYALLCLTCSLLMCWLDISVQLNSFRLLILSALLHNFEINLVWCQSLAFLRLGWKLNQIENQQYKDENYYNKFLQTAKVGFFFLLNTFFVVYFVLYFVVNSDDDSQWFINLEIICWTIGFLTISFLQLNIWFTLMRLKQMYCENVAVHGEARRVFMISVVFGVAFLTKTGFQWSLYTFYIQNNKAAEFMFQLSMTVMPMVWNVLPILTVFTVHYKNLIGNDESLLTDNEILDKTLNVDLYESLVSESVLQDKCEMKEDRGQIFVTKEQKEFEKKNKQKLSQISYESVIKFQSCASYHVERKVNDKIAIDYEQMLCQFQKQTNENKIQINEFFCLIDCKKTVFKRPSAAVIVKPLVFDQQSPRAYIQRGVGKMKTQEISMAFERISKGPDNSILTPTNISESSAEILV